MSPLALKDLFNGFFVVEDEEEVEAPEERETSQTRERAQERDVESRNENNVPSTQSQNNVNKQNAIKSVPQKSTCLLYTSPSPRDLSTSRMPSSA